MDGTLETNTNQHILSTVFRKYPELEAIRQSFQKELGIAAITDEHQPVIATGHQPVVYYPGILCKNYLAGKWAQQLKGKAVNFVVDSDKARINVPIPYQENQELFRTEAGIANTSDQVFADFFPSREQVGQFLQTIETSLATLSYPEFYKACQLYQQAFKKVFEETGADFIQTLMVLRNRFDVSLGYDIRDIRVSEVVKTQAFYQYVYYITRYAKRFQYIFNNAVKVYKSEHYQPVRSLHQANSWYELPFWVISRSGRSTLWCRQEVEEIQLSAETMKEPVVISTRHRNENAISEEMRQRIALYPKATTLTFMIRLFLCDGFVHGTGAIEYETINNEVLHSFLNLEHPLTFVTATGDIYLPLTQSSVDEQSLKQDYYQKKKWLEQIERNPMGLLSPEEAKPYKERKKEIAAGLQTEKDHDKRKKIHQQLTRIDEEVKTLFSDQIKHVNEILQFYDQLIKKKEVYFERQYPYFIYPVNHLNADMLDENCISEVHS